MSLARSVLRIGGDAALASGVAGIWLGVGSALAGDSFAQGLGRFAAIASAESWLALAPIALAVTSGASAALALSTRLRARARAAWLGLGAAVLGAAFLWHDALLAALVAAWPALGTPLARASAFATTQAKPAVLACAALAMLLCLARAALAPRARSARTRGPRTLDRAAVAALALLALAAGGLRAARAVLPGAGAKSVLLVVLDTVGARHLASGGYARNTMPELEALAARGVRFPQAYSAAPWTVPSHASLFTGLAPIRHGATQEHVQLAARFPTLADILRNQGFRTFAAAGNTVVGPYSQLDQGFARFLPTWRRDVLAASSGPRHPNNVAFERFLARVPRGERFFAFVNYIDAHSPYAPPPPDDARYGKLPRRGVDQSWQHYYTGVSALGSADFQELADLYDGELTRLSRDLEALLASLAAAGRAEDTLVIVTADHGENLGDHAHLDHVFNLYDSLLHVPLLVLGPGAPAGVVDPRLATSVDVFATVLRAAGVDAERWDSEGRDLLAPAEPRGELVHEYNFPNQALSAIEPTDLTHAGKRLSKYLRRLRALRGGDGWKLLWSSDGRHELYHVALDPDEREDLAAREPARVAEMTRRLEQRLAEQAGRDFSFASELPPRASAGFEGVDEETREQLESLGYVEAD